MDIKEYRYVCEVALQGGVSRAARRLYISQPSLSAYLKNLEARLGCRLFETVDGRLRPTREGEVYLEHARQILGIDAALMETLQSMREHKSGVVRIGVPVTRSSYVLPGLLQALAAQYPGIAVQVTECISKQLEELAHQRQVDFILANLPFKEYQLAYHLLREEQSVLAVPRGFEVCSLAQLRQGCRWPWLDTAHLQSVPFVLLNPGQRLRQVADALFLAKGVRPRVLLETPSAQTALALTRAGLAACLTYDSYCEAYPDPAVEVFCVGEPPIRHQFVAAYPEGAALSSPAQAVLEATVRYMGGGGGPWGALGV